MVDKLPVLEMFNELVRLGYIHPMETPDLMSDIGAFPAGPTITDYRTPDIPTYVGVHTYAELGQRSKRNSINSNDTK
jgi:hypothetical protein